MKRRAFITLLGGAAASSLAALLIVAALVAAIPATAGPPLSEGDRVRAVFPVTALHVMDSQ